MSGFQKFFFFIGLLAALAWFGATFELRDKSTPSIIPTSPPKVDVKVGGK